jgi:hypothetical protein
MQHIIVATKNRSCPVRKMQKGIAMLVLEIAVGVFIGLFVFWKFYQRSGAKEQANLEQLKIYEENSRRIKQRVDAVFAEFMNIFAGRLLTLEDDETISYKDAGIIELRLFMEHLGKMKEEIKTDEDAKRVQLEIDEGLKQKMLVELNDELSSMHNKAGLQAMSMFEEKLLEIANRLDT